MSAFHTHVSVTQRKTYHINTSLVTHVITHRPTVGNVTVVIGLGGNKDNQLMLEMSDQELHALLVSLHIAEESPP